MEKYFVKETLQLLSKHFIIKEQVLGTHFSGARLRIDAILQPVDVKTWKNKNVAFGIEFKSQDKLDSTKDKTLWIKQCIDYANTRWDEYGYLYIFSCPSIFDQLKYAVKDEGWLWNRILSNLGVGRLDNIKNYGWTFFLQDEHRIWSEKDGVVCGKKWSLKRKFGRSSFK